MSSPAELLSQIKKVLRYNKSTGEFIWLKYMNGYVKPGMIAGSVDEAEGYRSIYVFKRKYKAHRLAWLFVYGDWPKNQIDHINGLPDDNRIVNLRDVDQMTNQGNRKCHREGTIRWVSKTPKGRYQSGCQLKGKRFYFGTFDDPMSAHMAAKNRLIEMGILKGVLNG